MFGHVRQRHESSLRRDHSWCVHLLLLPCSAQKNWLSIHMVFSFPSLGVTSSLQLKRHHLLVTNLPFHRRNHFLFALPSLKALLVICFWSKSSSNTLRLACKACKSHFLQHVVLLFQQRLASLLSQSHWTRATSLLPSGADPEITSSRGTTSSFSLDRSSKVRAVYLGTVTGTSRNVRRITSFDIFVISWPNLSERSRRRPWLRKVSEKELRQHGNPCVTRVFKILFQRSVCLHVFSQFLIPSNFFRVMNNWW